MPDSKLFNVWAETFARASWQASLAVLVVLAVCWSLPGLPARVQAWLWRIALLKFLVVLFWIAPLELPVLSPLPRIPAADVSELSVEALTPSRAIAVSPSQRLASPWPILFLVWIGLVLWQTTSILAGFFATRRLRNACRPSREMNSLHQLAELSKAAGCHSPPTLLEWDGPGSPLLVGVFRPAIVLPRETQNHLSEMEREVIFSHELAHLCRGDILWGLLAALVRTLFCFHPLAWLAERRLHAMQEIAADEWAIQFRKQDSLNYATLLVSIVGKLTPSPQSPMMGVAVAGSHHSLQQRILAMQTMKPASRRRMMADGILLAFIAGAGLVPWTLVAASQASGKNEKKTDSPSPPSTKRKSERGQFEAFKDGVLTLRTNSGASLKINIPENAVVSIWNDAGGNFAPATIANLSSLAPKTWIVVQTAADQVTVRIGARASKTIGTYVSFRDDRLLILGKNLGESFTKKYGNNIHFNRFRDDTPIYESIDGGEYRHVGTANKVLPTVREGSVLTVHGIGDDNIIRVDIGVAKN